MSYKKVEYFTNQNAELCQGSKKDLAILYRQFGTMYYTQECVKLTIRSHLFYFFPNNCRKIIS